MARLQLEKPLRLSSRRSATDSVSVMPAVTIVFIVVAALSAFLIAAVVVGREAHRLDALAPRVVYEEEQALSFVAERLPQTRKLA